ncbi:hypothetical protein JCM10914A_37900 [Paenibacillus sp. JCM 10914]|uniref:hypothetical protein n=1 Tax=Paenibacillus sp. JCM 10914 TaxID=1236974 RepID=UPI0003CC5AD5|nr:hypothetical protein [Paenibacillus sp. JCM 10914]GAE04490.1 hypothetical protein JCM10914_540 [Paenibacillus sp. JCM 10914]
MKPSVLPPEPAVEDEALIRDYLLHTVLQSVVEQDLQILSNLNLEMTTIYRLNLRHIQKNVSNQIWNLQQQMREHGIRIENEFKDQEGVQVVYLCRGYPCSLLCDWPYVKEKSSMRLATYLNQALESEAKSF